MNDANPMEAMLLRQRERAAARLAADPSDTMAMMLVANRDEALADLHAEQRLDAARQLGELFELRLHGPSVDRGAIPLDAFIKVTEPLLRAMRAIAERQRYGVGKVNQKFKRMVADSLNVKLAGVAMGSTRLMLTGDGITDTGGESLLHKTLERTLGLLNAPSEEFFEAIDTVGIRGANALGEFAGAVHGAGMAIEITWPFGDEPLHWEGRTDELVRIKNLLQSVETPVEKEIELEGEVEGILATGRLLLRVPDVGKVTVRFALDKTHLAQQLVIRKWAVLRVMSSTYWDPAKQSEVSKYHLM